MFEKAFAFIVTALSQESYDLEGFIGSRQPFCNFPSLFYVTVPFSTAARSLVLRRCRKKGRGQKCLARFRSFLLDFQENATMNVY